MAQERKWQARLAVEQLESRLTPDTGFIRGLYTDVLHRTASDQEVNGWEQGMQRGDSTRDVAEQFWRSDEHRALEVNQYFQTFLNRAPSAAEQRFWIDEFRDSSEEEIQLRFVFSREFQHLHPDAQAFVQGLYQGFLGRPAEPGGLAGWSSQIRDNNDDSNNDNNNDGNNNNGDVGNQFDNVASDDREEVARDILDSDEARSRLVTSYYSDFLHRGPDAGGLAAWTRALNGAAGSNDDGDLNREEVAMGFLTSTEYFSKHSSGTGTTGTGTGTGGTTGTGTGGTTTGGTTTGGTTTGGTTTGVTTTGTTTGGTTGTTTGGTTTGGTTGTTTGTNTGGTAGSIPP